MGRPATLVVSFALYGLVLMLAPRLPGSRERRDTLRRPKAEAPPL